MRRWMAPGDLTATGVEFDERVGGRYRIWQSGADGDAGGCRGVGAGVGDGTWRRWAQSWRDRGSAPCGV